MTYCISLSPAPRQQPHILYTFAQMRAKRAKLVATPTMQVFGWPRPPGRPVTRQPAAPGPHWTTAFPGRAKRTRLVATPTTQVFWWPRPGRFIPPEKGMYIPLGVYQGLTWCPSVTSETQRINRNFQILMRKCVFIIAIMDNQMKLMMPHVSRECIVER